MKKHLLKWRSNARERLTRVCETERFQQEIALYQEVIHWDESQFFAQLPELMRQLESDSVYYRKAKKLVERNHGENNPVFAHFFCDQWYQSLSDSIRQAQVLELEENKEKLLADLYQRMETLRDMNNVTEQGDVKGLGRLWDMAGAKLSRSDVAAMKSQAQFLRKNPKLLEMAEKLGRMASEVDDPSLNKAPAEEPEMVEEKSDMAVDDIVGVHEDDDLNKLLPNETLFLAYPELEVVFYKRFADKRLMNYRTSGKTRTLRKVKTHRPEHRQADIEKGPFIICVDASGSMSGFPEQCAKAMAYALMQIALEEDRDCYVMLFSTEHIMYELTRKQGLREASDFLSYTFHGGTDFEPVIFKAIELMQGKRYRNADLLIVSDFIAPKQSEELAHQVTELKKKHNRLHAICLSKYGNPELVEMFDHCWHYHPNLMGRLFKRR